MTKRTERGLPDGQGQAGFTLIELLVVIAIIGILSSVVLAALGSARNKGNDAKTKEQLSSIRSAAEIYYSTNGSYGSTVDVCSGGMFADTASGLAPLTTAGNYPSGVTVSCHSNGSAYAVSATLLSGSTGFWCVDSAGASKGEASQVANGIYACP